MNAFPTVHYSFSLDHAGHLLSHMLEKPFTHGLLQDAGLVWGQAKLKDLYNMQERMRARVYTASR